MDKRGTEIMGMPLGLLIVIVLMVLAASILLFKLSRGVAPTKIFP